MTTTILTYAGVILAAYVIGGIPFGLIIGKLHGIDIRSQGSGNIGATNVVRCVGKPWGIFCFVLDFCKGAGPVLAVTSINLSADMDKDYLLIAAAIGTVLGHVFCPYLKFKGGKGIATAAGALCVLSWASIVAAFLVWLISLLIWKYVGLSSVLAAATLPITALFLKHYYGSPEPSIIGLFIAISTLAIFKHKANIARLIEGTEPKIGSNKNEAEEKHA